MNVPLTISRGKICEATKSTNILKPGSCVKKCIMLLKLIFNLFTDMNHDPQIFNKSKMSLSHMN